MHAIVGFLLKFMKSQSFPWLGNWVYDLMHHVNVFVKDESNNLMSTATTLRSTINYHL